LHERLTAQSSHDITCLGKPLVPLKNRPEKSSLGVGSCLAGANLSQPCPLNLLDR